MIDAPEEYRRSSYGVNAWGDSDDRIGPHTLYIMLGYDDEARRQAYRDLFKYHIDEQVISDIRKACKTGTPLGNDRFRNMVERRLRCKVGQNRRGRPDKGI